MTRDYSIIVPLMISNVISVFVSYRFQHQPLYEALTHQEGVFLPSGEAREHLARMRVSDVREPATGVQADAPLENLEVGLKTGRHAWPVTDGGRIVGLLSGDARTAAPSGATAGQFSRQDYPYVHPDHPLSLALQKMGDHRLDMLPVVSRADISRLLGAVTLDSVLRAYGVGMEPPDSTEAL